MDQSLYLSINRFAARTAWAHPFATAYANYGVVVFAGILLAAWWRARSTGDLHRLAGALWSAAAAGIALGLGQIIGGIIDRHRPYETLHGVHVLVSRTTDFSIPSDHATAVGAVAVGLWISDRPLGRATVALAVLMAFTRVYVGAHYATDVLAGLALGGLVSGVGATIGTRIIERILAWANHAAFVSAFTGRATAPNA
ncbi:phosphatase PAP2 family protein [Aquihabitans sp. McL0605]|uniref:phosphatase PAP2 family protein n=1 Tax=Aquihabitans sp. McL0605 TaxID=3415671 RepID=UPI003CEA8762